MTGRAGSAGILAMRAVTGKTTQALMNTGWRAIITGSGLPLGARRVTLVAERLPLIGRDIYDSLSVEHLRQRQLGDGHMLGGTAIEKRNRGTRNLLLWTGRALSFPRRRHDRALPVHAVAGETGNHWLGSELGLLQVPGSIAIDRRDEFANRPAEMHAVTAEAVVHQQLSTILFVVEEDVLIRRAVATRMPGCILLLMTCLAALRHLCHVDRSEMRLVRNLAAHVRKHAAHVVEVESGLVGKDAAVTFGAGDVAMS